MSEKIARRASSVFASSSRQGTAVERACAAACIQAKFGYSESANEQSSRAQGGSEPDRRRASRAMTADQVHTVAVVGERANSGQRGRFRRRCRWRAEQTWEFSRIREISRHQAQARNTPVQCGVAAAILASEGPAPVSVGRQHARNSFVPQFLSGPF